MILAQDVTQHQIHRFIQEARATAKLDHPNIIKVFEVGESPKNYFTMEYIEGDTLTSHIREKDIKPKEIAALIAKTAEAIQAAHEKEIIHRDIKPSNIMLTKENEPKVMDFGLAKVIDSQLSRAGSILGTPAYMAPEQAQNQTANARTSSTGVSSVAFSPKNDIIVSTANEVCLWDTTTGKIFPGAKKFSDIKSCNFSLTENKVILGGDRGKLILWDFGNIEDPTDDTFSKFFGHRDRVLYCAFSPDSKRIISGDGEGTILKST